VLALLGVGSQQLKATHASASRSANMQCKITVSAPWAPYIVLTRGTKSMFKFWPVWKSLWSLFFAPEHWLTQLGGVILT
jgi:hypothetical protein